MEHCNVLTIIDHRIVTFGCRNDNQLITQLTFSNELVVLVSHSSCYIFNFEDQTWRNDGPVINDSYGSFLYLSAQRIVCNYY